MTTEPYRHVESARRFEPTEGYVSLRDTCPVHHEADHQPDFYVLTRFDDVAEAVRNHDLWLNREGPGVFYQGGGALGTTDDPDHARHRRVLRSAFVPTTIDRLEPRITAIVDELLSAMLPLGRGDFVDLIAGPLPALAIAELLGVNPDDRADFHRWSTDAVTALTGGDLDDYHHAKEQLGQAVDRGMDERDAMVAADEELPDDVLTLLAAARSEGTLSPGEARHIGYQLLVAGHETTTSLLGLLLHRLIERPELIADLRADLELIPAAIEEGLRFDSPVHGLFRTNAVETSIEGTTIPANSKVQMCFAAANRDPAQFEAPDEFRVDRPKAEIGKHLAFGWGIHHCIGAPLARLSIRVALRRLLELTTDIEFDGVPTRNDSFVLHGLTSLPIRWTTR